MKKVTTLLLALLATMMLPAQVDITFRVDMSGLTVSGDGVHVAGDLNGWSTTDNPMTDQGNNIYMTTVSLDPGRDIKYKFLNGNAWGSEEAAPANCTVGGSDRIFTVPNNNDTLDLVPFGDCPSVVEKKHVIFRVDMSAEAPSADGIHVAGNFQAWDPGASTMTDMGNGIYEYSADVLATILTVQYKYVNGNAWGGDESIPETCSNGEGNRFEMLMGDTIVLNIFTFGSCDTVATATNVTLPLDHSDLRMGIDRLSQDLKLYLSPELGTGSLQLRDLQGRSLYHRSFTASEQEIDAQIDLSQLTSGIYLLQIQTQRGIVNKRFIWNN